MGDVTAPVKTQVLIADNDPLARDALMQLFIGDPRTNVAGATSDPADVVRIVQQHPVDVLIIAARLGEAAGVDVVRTARAARPGLRSILLASGVPPHVARRLARLGIQYTVDRETALQNLQQLVTGVETLPTSWARLTHREKSVAELLVAGLNNRDISHRLGVSYNSVKTFTNRIYRKTGTTGRVHLTNQWYAERVPCPPAAESTEEPALLPSS